MKANFETGLKICGHCKREPPIEMFYKSSRTSDGLSCSCNDCRKEYRQSQSGREVSKKARIKHTQKYSEKYKQIRQTEEWKEKHRNYNHTEKGREGERLRSKRRRELGKVSELHKRRYQTDLNYKTTFLLRGRFHKILKGKIKSDHTLDLLGCSIDELKAHLEMQFEPGMTWDNLGKGEGKWQIDHIIPCSYFDLTKEENQRICFNYRNLQPLWASENNTKKAKVPDNVEEIVEFLRKEINNEILYRN